MKQKNERLTNEKQKKFSNKNVFVCLAIYMEVFLLLLSFDTRSNIIKR